MNELITQIYKVDCPISLRIKFWLRAYTLETKFYKDLNSDLLKGQAKIYLPYIKLLYAGLADNCINVNVKDDLYRGALINKEEIQNLINHKNNRKNSDLPYELIYCKSFMSFSLEKNVALRFMNNKNPTEKTIRVLYILKSESGLNHKSATNADLNGISYFESEREILLFPFSVYEIDDVKNKGDYYEIYLNYLGKYKKLFSFKNQTDLYNSIFKSKFIKELELVGLSAPIWLAKKSLCQIKIKDKFGYCYGSGFCCLIPFKNMKIPVLMTVNHLLNKERLQIGNRIEIEYGDNEEFIMVINKNSKIFTNPKYDITIIEIKEDNYQFNKLIFMDVDEDIFNSKDFLLENFNRQKAYILQYSCRQNYYNEQNEKNQNIIKKNIEEFTKDKNYKIEEGRIIVEEDEYNIIHNIPTSPGAGGGPIISHNKFKVIGYHIGKKKSHSEYQGLGHLIKLPILDFIKQFYS